MYTSLDRTTASNTSEFFSAFSSRGSSFSSSPSVSVSVYVSLSLSVCVLSAADEVVTCTVAETYSNLLFHLEFLFFLLSLTFVCPISPASCG